MGSLRLRADCNLRKELHCCCGSCNMRLVLAVAAAALQAPPKTHRATRLAATHNNSACRLLDVTGARAQRAAREARLRPDGIFEYRRDPG